MHKNDKNNWHCEIKFYNEDNKGAERTVLHSLKEEELWNSER